MRRAAKRDLSEKGIVRVLEQLHMSVYRLNQPVDLLVGFRGKNYLVEVKSGRKGYGKGLNDNQTEFANSWRGGDVVILHDEIDAYDWYKIVAGQA
ncbi:hypothetical protein [Bartonella sp. LJL80]